MKKILIIASVLFLVPVVFMTSCKKDKTEPTTPTNSTTYSITLTGTVVDVNMNPLSGVDVTIAGTTKQTNTDGTFYFASIAVPKERFEVTFSLAGYFTLSRSAIPESGAKIDMEVGLISETDFNYSGSTTFSSSTGGSLTLSNGCQITFPTNAFVTSTGAAYSGNVQVKACYLDPTMNNYPIFTFGGDLHGKDTTGAVVMLNPFSGLNVVITDGSGNSLQLDEANSVKATVQMQIPLGLSTIAPASIDLMEYNETEGMCMAAGSAAKSGDKYMGQVGHFSYWSCQKIHAGKAYVAGRVTDGTNPVSGVRVHIGRLIGLSDLIVITDADGNYSATIGSGLAGYISIPNYFGQTIVPVNIPVLADDATFNAPDIVVSPLKKVTGRLVNCNNQAIAGGRVVMSWYSNFPPYNKVHAACFSKPNGTFELQIETGATYADFHYWGNNAEVVSNYYYLPTDPTNVGDIVLCPPIQTGPNKVTLSGGQFTTATTFQAFNDSKTGTMVYDTAGTPKHLNISVYGTDGDIYIQTDGVALGTYQVGTTTVSMYIMSVTPYFSEPLSTGSVTITRVGPVGTGLIEGTFTGTTASGVQVSGQFSVPRGQNQYN